MSIMDKNFKLVEFTQNQVIKSSSYKEVFSKAGKGDFYQFIISVDDTNMKLIFELDGNNIIDELLLQSLTKSSLYNMDKDKNVLPFGISPLDDKVFKLTFDRGIEYTNNFSIKLKRAKSGNKKLQAGLAYYQDGSL